MLADTQRFENLGQLVSQFGTQTALAKRLRKADGRCVLTQPQISSTFSDGRLNPFTARQIEREFGLPPKTLDLLSLKKLEEAGRSWLYCTEVTHDGPRLKECGLRIY